MDEKKKTEDEGRETSDVNSQSQIANRKSGRKRKQKFSFPTVSPCPRCRGTSTRAVSTQGKVQYRKCMAPVCRKSYTVIGTPVAKKP